MSSAPALMVPLRGDAHPSTRMSYVDYLNQLDELSQLQLFDPIETHLYIKLLMLFNNRRKHGVWATSHLFADSFLCVATGLSANTLKKARTGLVARGLLHHETAGPGRGKMGLWQLLQVAGNEVEKPALKPSLKLSNSDSFSDGFTGTEAVNVSINVSRNVSKFDTNNKSIQNKQIVTETGRAGAENEDEIFASESPAASASHTGGGAAQLTALEPGQSARGGFVDPRLSDDDPRKWEARPENAQMVDAYLSSHPDPAISKHAGKGQLFIDYYEGFEWCSKNGRPIMNWRAVARQFSFIDYKAEREKAVAINGSSKVQQARTGVEDALEILRRRQREGGVSNG